MTEKVVLKPEESYEIPIEKATEKEIYVCACGKSAKLPFCDGTHAKIPGEQKPIRIKVKDDKLCVRAMKEVVLMKAAEAEKQSGVRVYNDNLIYYAFGAIVAVALASICKYCRK